MPLVLETHRIWRQLEAEHERTLYVACGALILARASGQAAVHGQSDFVGETAAIAARFDIPHELLDATAIAQRFPQFTGLADTSAYYEPGGGYLLPEACIEAQLASAARHGATIRTGIPVEGVEQSGAGVIVGTPDGPILADRAIVAAGAWTGPLLGAPFDRLLRVERQVFHWFDLEPDHAVAAPSPVFIWLHGGAAPGHFYGFPPLPGARNVKLATEHEGISTTMDTLDRNVAASESAELYRGHVTGRIEGVSPITSRHSVCAYTVTPDHGFIIDRHPGMDRVTVIAACSGHGFKHSAGIGKSVAEVIATGRSSIDLAPFRLGRLTA